MRPFVLKPLLTLAVLLSALATAQGPRFAVFPFVSSDPRLGVAVADRLTHAVAGPNIPPELALSLVPPLLLQEGVLSPLELLGSQGTGSRFGASLLRELLDVETAVTGRVRLAAGGLELELFIARDGEARNFIFLAPEAFPERLVAQARGALRAYAGLTPLPDARLGIDLSSPYGTFVDGLLALGGGFPEEAAPLLSRAGAALRAEPRWAARAAALGAVQAGRADARARFPLLAAAVSLNTEPFDAAAVTQAFAASDTELAALWGAILAAQGDDVAAAQQGFTALTSPLGQVEGLLYRFRTEADADVLTRDLQGLVAAEPDALGVLLGGLFLAQGLEDVDLEADLASRLTDLAPTFAYPYERLSQRAFDQDDPAAAAAALRTASRLEPQVDLYWTNLGWAYYLLGVLGESETASVRALELNPDEFIARYNLGLVQVVTGRLEPALATYAAALESDLRGDNEIDPAAILDLQDALALYPDAPGVHYALGTLLELRGDLRPAALQFERFARRGRGPRVQQAWAQARLLRAPPPPLTITPGAVVGVGPDALTLPDYLPGDQLTARFEVSTPGDALPTPLEVRLTLTGPDGAVIAETSRTERGALPANTVAVELAAALAVPDDAVPGRYRLGIDTRARGQVGRAEVPLTLAARPPTLARRLVGRGVTLRDLGGGPLYAGPDVPDDTLLRTLVGELERAAEVGAEGLPEVTSGRFAGRGGATLLSSSRARDVRDFLRFLLAAAPNTDGGFADLYLRWAQQGAPLP